MESAHVPSISGSQVIANAPSESGYHATSTVVDYPEEVKQEWCVLQQRTDCSYFQSWGWIGAWLELIVPELRPLLVRVWYHDVLVGMGIFVHRNVRRRLFVGSNALYLNEYPFEGRNMSIEYNGMLCERGHERAVYCEATSHLFTADSSLDEVIMGAIDTRAVAFLGASDRDCRQPEIGQRLLEESDTWAVDLRSIGTGKNAFLDVLSKNRRLQIRRALRLYEDSGRLRVEQASDLATALEFFSGLKKLHTLRWQNAGRRGSFDNPLWEKFHRSLVESRFADGEIQLIKVCNDKIVVGFLYNLVWRKHVYVLQTGFASERNNILMPGYVAHSMAIEHNKQLGMIRYDLMRGDESYKKILCNRFHTLAWVAMQRRRMRFRLENALLASKRYISGT
jgi:CelD/BcsL family acetyltransferase involved in cellulose biosynthesis